MEVRQDEVGAGSLQSWRVGMLRQRAHLYRVLGLEYVAEVLLREPLELIDLKPLRNHQHLLASALAELHLTAVEEAEHLTKDRKPALLDLDFVGRLLAHTGLEHGFEVA